MKRLILVIAIAFCGVSTLSAQEYVVFGAKGGVNFSNFAGDGFASFDEDSNARTAFHLGLVAEVPLSDRFSIQPEVLYSAQGFDIAQIEDGQDVEYRLDYVTVPVLAKFYVTDGLSLVGGPQFGYLAESEIKSENTETELDSENFNNFDLAVGLGAEYKFNKFFLYGRYNAGLTDIYENESLNAKNSVIQAGIGFMF